MMRVDTTNNFDLIRLVAASQVVLVHATEHLLKLSHSSSMLLGILHFLPGVPIFFFVSGFLISNSYEKTSGLTAYAFNRIIRIFPALWACFFVSVAAVVLVGFLPVQNLLSLSFVKWAVAQLSFFQFYNPEFMRSFGVGVLNGSLWTICVELQFYILMPLLAWLIRFKSIYVLLALASFAFNIFLNSSFGFTGMLAKLSGVTFLPWIGMFMLGHLALNQWQRIQSWFSNTFLIWFGAYVVAAAIVYYLQHRTGVFMSGNQLLFPLQILLGGVVLAAAFTKKDWARRALRHNDISYGIYIYHMPIINLILFTGLAQGVAALPLTLIATALMAVLSWLLVEQPALRRKAASRNKIYRVASNIT